MRTTVTLDPDVERLIKDDAHARSRSFKVSLNEAVRDAFRLRRQVPAQRKRFVVKAKAMGLRTDIDYTKIDQWTGDLEVRRFLKVTHRLEEERKRKNLTNAPARKSRR